MSLPRQSLDPDAEFKPLLGYSLSKCIDLALGTARRGNREIWFFYWCPSRDVYFRVAPGSSAERLMAEYHRVKDGKGPIEIGPYPQHR